MPRRLAARAALLAAVTSAFAGASGEVPPFLRAPTTAPAEGGQADRIARHHEEERPAGGARPSTRQANSEASSRIVSAVAVSPIEAPNTVRLPRFPALSPDGAFVAFCWHGDIWFAPTNGKGLARRLTSDPFDDLYPVFSPDGNRVAFTSERLGGGNLFTVRLDGTDLRQVTTSDRYFALYDWSGGQLWASAKLEQENYPGGRSYSVPEGGGDATRAFDAFGTTPAVSPDGSKILFTRGAMPWSRRGYRGSDARDVWLYDRGAKTYTRLTDWDGNDGRPRWVDDHTFVYASDREDDTVNLYLARVGDAAGLGLVRLTHAKGVDVEDFAVSRDGKTLVYAQWDRLYCLDLTNRDAAPVPIALDAEQDDSPKQYRDIGRTVSESALSPDGKTLAVVALGQVWVRGTEPHGATRLVDSRFARCRDLAWSPDGAILYFSSDVGGVESIYMATAELSRDEVRKAATQMAATATSQPVASQPAATKPSPASIRAELFSAPVVRPTSGPGSGDREDMAELARLLGLTSEPSSTTSPVRYGDQTVEFDVLPGTAPSTTRTATTSVTQAASSRSITRPAEASYLNRWPDAVRFRVEPLVNSGARDTGPSPSPDGKSLAFQRGNGQLWVRDLASGRERLLFDGWSEALEWQWRGDSKQIAFVTEDRNNNRDVFLVSPDGSKPPVNVSKHPDNDYRPRYSADGKVLVFLSQRVENEADVYRLFLDRDLETLQGADLDQYYKDASEAAKKRERPKPTTVRPSTRPSPTGPAATRPTTRPTTRKATTVDPLDDAYLRVKKIAAFPGDESDLEITPAGDRIVFTARNPDGNGRSTYTMYRDGPPQRIQGEMRIAGLTFDGDRAVGVAGDRAATLNVATGEMQFLDVSARLGFDRRTLYAQEFGEAARLVGAFYYDPTLNGLDWPAVTKRYAALVEDAATPGEFDWVANKLIGELNGSHLGIDMPATANPNTITVGRLGVRSTRVGDGYRVDEVYPSGPAASGAFKLAAGDVIVGVEGQAFDAPTRTLDAALLNRVGIETLVRVRRAGREFDVLLTPIAFYDAKGGNDETSIAYDAWRNAQAKRVADLSKGRLGYIHLRAMNEPSLETFERDLFAAADGKDGLIVDVRNNGGGWTTDRILSSIAAAVHAYTRPRGFTGDARGAYPQDRLFIQRYTLPMAMLCNEKSFSNAEIVAHAFQTLKRGTLVGQTTAGGVISTGATTLLDGTSVRLPNRAWFLPDGTNMELHGAVPEVRVPMRPEDEAAGDDPQLRAAVDELLKRLDGPTE